MRKLRLGVVGCGDVAFRSYLPPISRFADKAELVATCDSAVERAKSAQERFGAKRAYQKLSELLADDEVDAVINLTPVRWHAEVGMECLKAGKHLYQEKPLASTVGESDALIVEAETRGVTLVCAPATNMLPSRRYGRHLLREGAIGKVVLAVAHASTGGPARWLDYSSDPTWFYQEGAGPLIDTGVYAIDYLVDTLGPARRVMGLAGIAVPEVVSQAEGAKGKGITVAAPDNAALLMDFGNATFAVLESSFCVVAQQGPPLEFYGGRGSLAVHHWWDDPALEIYREGADQWEPVTIPAEFASLPDFGWGVGVLHLVDCVLTGAAPTLSGQRARHVLEIMLAVYESSREGRAVEMKTSF
ncbi:MAG: Gfo/Idh/MocA family oxidoreductase [Armatimonadetes bacterium]|nr:Gfo/Idh/MocA family oxidoreductase [Armatimonadota bacterium]